jgi:tetratricopeptide (TPR) repeat protein
LFLRRWLAVLLLGGALATIARGETPADPVAPLDQAIAAAEESLAKGDFPAANGRYRAALFQGWLLKGTLDGLDSRLPEAREALRQATTYVPEGAAARRTLATVLLQIGDAASAIALLSPVADRDPQDVETRRLLARGLAEAGRHDEAVAKLDEASAAASDDPETAFLIGTGYLSLKRPEAAERLFAQVVRARPIPQTHVLIGRVYRDAGEYGRARDELRAALAEDPGARRAHYYLGMVALADANTGPDRLALARAEFQEELRIDPEDPLANSQIGEVLMEAERPAEALPFLETAVRVDPRAVYACNLGRNQLALDQPSEATRTLRHALELAATQGTAESDVQKIHYQLGLALRKLGLAEEAATHFAEARRLAAAATEEASGLDGSPAARAAQLAAEGSPLAGLSPAERDELRGRAVRALARAYLNLGVLQAQSPTPAPSRERFALAAALFANAADLDPDFPKVQLSLGVARFNARQFDQAVAPLERALAAAPDDVGVRSMLATSLLNTGSWDRAAELLRTDPEREANPSLQSAYGLALVRGGRGAEAERVLSPLVAEHGDSAELRLLLGQALLAQGKASEAVPHLEAAARLAPEDPRARDELGHAYQKLGRTGLAQREFEAARQLEAGKPGGAP